LKEAMATSQCTASSVEPSIRGPVRFFWLWLTTATAASIAGNVVHAILNAPKGSTTLAAAAAVVPPAVLLGSTHSVALLVRARRTGPSYWCALLMTVALAGCAFVLSFDALSDLATSLGMASDRAWLWPCAIDLSIAQSTLALLSLNAPVRVGRASRSPGAQFEAAPRRSTRDGRAPRLLARGSAAIPPSPTVDQPTSAAAADDSADDGGPGVRAAAATDVGAPTMDPAAVHRWQPIARKLVRAGVTQKDPEIVARILAENAAGIPPSKIGRRLEIHHSTVSRILERADGLTG
jgi:hypothetical protein